MAFTRKVFLIIDRLLLTLTVITAFIHFEGWKSRFFRCISIFLIWICFLLLNFLRYLWGIVITTVVTLLLQTKARSGIKQIHLPSAGSWFSYCLPVVYTIKVTLRIQVDLSFIFCLYKTNIRLSMHERNKLLHLRSGDRLLFKSRRHNFWSVN